MTVLQGGGAAALGVTRSDIAALQGAAQSCESVQEIINIGVTAEALAVATLGNALQNAANGTLALPAEAVGALRAARAAEQAHFEVLSAAGAQPLTTTFTLPNPRILTDTATFLTTLITLEETFIAAYAAAAQEFAILRQPRLAQIALQIGAVEAEHRVGVRFFAIEAGAISGVPNDIAFEPAYFRSLGEAAATLQRLGLIGGSGTPYSYPGPGAIDTTGVTNLRP
jgi:hypothetical protein